LVIEAFNVSGLDLLLVKSGLGVLSNGLVLKDNEAGSSFLSVELLNEDI